METKYIEGTDKQYSIREDGVCFKNYIIKISSEGETIKTELKNKKVRVSITSSNCKTIYLNKKGYTTVNKLLLVHFGFTNCKKCKEKIHDKNRTRVRTKNVCKSCFLDINNARCLKKRKKKKLLTTRQKKLNAIRHRREYRERNRAKYSAIYTKSSQIDRDLLARSYIATKLRIPVKLLTDELYLLKKNQILLHRELNKQSLTH